MATTIQSSLAWAGRGETSWTRRGRRRATLSKNVAGVGATFNVNASGLPATDTASSRSDEAARCRQRVTRSRVKVREAGRVVNVHAVIAHRECG